MYKKWAVAKFLLCILPLLLLTLAGCGEGGQPLILNMEGVITIGSTTPSAETLGVFAPETQTVPGGLEVQIIQEFSDSFELEVLNLDMSAVFANVGAVNLELDPNNPSTLIVYKLNSNNQPEGVHTLILNLIVETPDQNLVFDGVVLESVTANLSLVTPIPTTGFLFQGQPYQIQITQLVLTLDPNLIVSDFDPS